VLFRSSSEMSLFNGLRAIFVGNILSPPPGQGGADRSCRAIASSSTPSSQSTQRVSPQSERIDRQFQSASIMRPSRFFGKKMSVILIDGFRVMGGPRPARRLRRGQGDCRGVAGAARRRVLPPLTSRHDRHRTLDRHAVELQGGKPGWTGGQFCQVLIPCRTA
jgi:hypothetical protein